MKREDVLKSPDYWTAKMQLSLYNCAEEYMQRCGKNRTQLAEHLGVSKGYVTQLLDGKYDQRISKMVEMSLACGFVPQLSFIPVDVGLQEMMPPDVLYHGTATRFLASMSLEDIGHKKVQVRPPLE